MTIQFQLARPNEEKSHIAVSIFHHGKRWRKSTGVSVLTRTWSIVKQKTTDADKQAALKVIRIGLERDLNDLSTTSDITLALSRIHDGTYDDDTDKELSEVLEHPSFMEHFKAWSDRECTSKRQHQLCYRIVRDLMGGGYDWNDVNDVYYHTLIRKMNGRGYAPNNQGNIIKRVKSVMSEGYKYGWHTNTAYQRWRNPHEESFAIALTDAEMQMLWDAENLTRGERRVADLAWAGYLTAARFSDYSRLTEDNIKDGAVTWVQKKTDEVVLIPCSPRLKTIMERNGGRVPKMVEQVFNRELKNVCRKVGINSIIEVPMSKRKMMGWGNEPIEKWRLVSSHTLRRSACTQLYKSGLPISLCCKVSGHASPQQFLKYCKITLADAYDKLKDNAFFK